MKFFPGYRQQWAYSLRTCIYFASCCTCSMPLPINRVNLPSYPRAADLNRCSSHTDPNVMHFPSAQNLHSAHQTDKYLIGLSWSHPPPWQPLQWAWEAPRDFSAVSFSGNQSPCGDKVCPRSPANAPPAGAGGACLPGEERRTDARA